MCPSSHAILVPGLGLVEGVDLIFRIVFQISGQDNASYKIQKSYWHFQIKKFCFCYLPKQKFTVEVFVLTRVLFATTILTTELLSENSTNSLKVKMRTKLSCKILIDIL